ncbi:SIMPL domain-containing protein [Paracoccus beibuensis]|uniref:SIMPL domain-containing protein n=1 Tax=Paracoccus beibuensis TaxID=547602 RepID=UPI00223F6A54|nr:SIMPL domain-containing protein [Paracoccus beibuensis]
MRPIFTSSRVRRLALSGAVAVLAAAPLAAAAQSCGMAGPSRLTVSGEGQSRVAPDMATVQLGVTTQADSAAEAMRLNSDQQAAVIEALRGAGIDETQIQTSGLTLNPMMNYPENQAPEVTGYQASNIVSVRVTDLARTGEVLDAIVAAGANEINGITFSREDGAEALDQARRDAVADARRKAEVLAEASGTTLGPIIALRDVATGGGGPRPMMRMDAAMAESVPVQPGEVEMSAQVEIEYGLTGDGACAPMHHGKRHGHGKDAPEVVPPMPGDAAPAPDEPIVPGIEEPLPEAPAN